MSHAFIRHLKEDHDRQRETGRRLIEASGAEQRERLREAMYEALYPHMIGEEASIFPYMKDSGDEEARDGTLEALQEHHVAKIVLGELMKLSLESEVFKAKAKVLNELNSHHIEEEEENLFPWLERNCSEKELGELFERYEDGEKRAEGE